MLIQPEAQEKLRVMRIESPFALSELAIMQQLHKWTQDQNRWIALAQGMQEGIVAFFVASSRPDRLEGFFAIALPVDGLQDMPQVIHFQCEGGVKLRRKMVQEVVAFVRAAGYTTFAAINGSGVPDEIWVRAFREGGEIVSRQTLFEFKVKEHASVGNNTNPVRRKQEQKRPVERAGRHNARSAKGPPRAVRGKPDKRASGRRSARV
jgi:hypothetical protein